MTSTSPAVAVQDAYRLCERTTRREAANFFYGIRLLPRAKRQAMSAVYAFARRIDDIGDDGLDRDAQAAALASERAGLAALENPAGATTTDPVMLALADAHHRFNLPLDALQMLIDGVELDIAGTRYDTFDELVVYCRDVAGTIGRLCLAIFTNGSYSAAQSQLADDLGVALQLTNILRDVREDHERGRMYLPQDDLARLNCTDLLTDPADQAAAVINYEAQRAQTWFDRGLALANELDSRSAACLLAMSGIYRAILARILAEPQAVLTKRISLPPHQKAWVALRSLVAGAQPPRRRALMLRRT